MHVHATGIEHNIDSDCVHMLCNECIYAVHNHPLLEAYCTTGGPPQGIWPGIVMRIGSQT